MHDSRLALLFLFQHPKQRGKTHNWELSRKIRESIPIPLFLAGGLNAGNAREAIETVEPFGLDLCSSVRTDGQLDQRKLDAFFQRIW